ncbi:hypothetical protein NPIL_30281 [Nephila pilipes]|uniref:Uncharacterized protein n=1 Tax=Nephila pilipes TaxID=299642 RepID=A0A8X6N9U3_NEPPI|nr:hypothetical protein NPIL_30281 [Nephila pilipes]
MSPLYGLMLQFNINIIKLAIKAQFTHYKKVKTEYVLLQTILYKLSSVSRSCSSNIAKALLSSKRKPYHPQGQTKSQSHKYESSRQNKNQGAREIPGPTNHYDNWAHDDLVGQNIKHIETSEQKDGKEQL